MAKPETKKVEKDVEDAIFAPEPEVTKDPVRGVVTKAEEGALAEQGATATATEPKSAPLGTSESKDTVSISADQFNSLMERLSELEGVALRSNRGEDDIFNPLAVVTEDHTANVCFLEDELVVGYKVKMRPDGSETYTWLAKDQATGELRTYCTLLLDDGKGNIREETMDYVQFIESAIPVKAIIKKREDIGKLKEHGLVNQMTWDGKNLVPTGQKIMSGAREQKFLF